jgi:uncharacterized membrane protein
MASYASRLRQDVPKWVRAGLIDEAAGAAILRDTEAHERRSVSFGTILAVMAGLLLGAAILIFVAANWEALPRLTRVGALFAIIAGGYILGATLKLYDHAAIGESLWLVAAAAFGAAIALIGQMYHLAGDETEAILAWWAGTALAAAALRSGPLTVAAAGVAVFWLFSRSLEFWRASEFPHLFAGMAAVLWLVSYWTRSAAARHLLVLSMVVYTVLLAIEYHVTIVATVLAAASVVLFALAVLIPNGVERLVRLDRLLPVHCLLGFLAAIVLIQIEVTGESGAGFAVAAATAFTGIGAALLLFGRESRGLRWIAYIGFAVELCLVYILMIGSMLGTAGFFLVAGVLLGVTALAIIRIEKRLSDPPALSARAA